SIIEEFLDGTALDPSLSTATVDPRDGGSVVAPGLNFDSSDCSGGALTFPDGGGTVSLDAGIYQLDSLSIGGGTNVVSDGGLDLRLCSGGSIVGTLHAGGPLRITSWGSLSVSNTVESPTSLYLVLPDAGSSLKASG